jgi:hypothetical protein
LKKEQEKNFQKTQEEAETQLRKYLETDEILKNTKKLRAFTIVTVKDEMFWKELKISV